MRQLGVEHLVTVVLSADGIASMELYVDAAAKCGAKKIKFGLPAPLGRAADDAAARTDWSISTEEEKIIYNELVRLNAKYRGRIHVVVWNDDTTDHPKLTSDRSVKSILNFDTKKTFPCGAGSLHLNITEEGVITPCQLLPPTLFGLCNYDRIGELTRGTFSFDLPRAVRHYCTRLADAGVDHSRICSHIRPDYE